MTNYVYRLKQPTISVKYGATTKTIAVSQTGTLTCGFDIFELYGAESVLRQGSWVERVTIGVTLSYTKFDEGILSELIGTTDADKDVDGDAKSDYTHIYFDGDSYDHPDFDVYATLQSEDGTKEMGVRVAGVMFNNMNFAIIGAGAVQPELSGNGDNLHLHLPTSA